MSSRAMDLVAVGSLLLGLAASLYTLINALVDQNWTGVGSAILLLGAVGLVVAVLARGHRRADPPKTTTFLPFTSLDGNHVWHRTRERDEIVDAILRSRATVPIVVGSSGAGKSTLLEVMVGDELKRRDPTTTYRVIAGRYETLRGQLESILATTPADGPLVIVLDQFEGWLAHVGRQPDDSRVREHQWLAETLEHVSQSPNITILLGIRQEWYYNLQFLKDLVPSPGRAVDIQGPRVNDKNDEMRRGMLESFTEVLGDAIVAEQILGSLSADGRLSPLEVQIVGAVVEARQGDCDGDFDLAYFNEVLGGADGAIDIYFKSVLDGFERPKVCMKIMCALSGRTRFRVKTKTNELRAGLFEDEKLVTHALDYLVGRRLVVAQGGSKTYELAHDFLAEFYSHKSAAELDPTERDNILVQSTSNGRGNGVLLKAGERKQLRRWRLGRIVLLLLLVVMGLRFLYFGLDPTVFGPSIARPVSGSMFDSTYLLILTPYAAWIVYVAAFYDRVFIHLKEEALQRALSVLIVINLILSTLVGIFIPIAWLFAIGYAGTFFAVKLLWLGQRAELSAPARRSLRLFGAVTLVNVTIAGGIGIVAIALSVTYVKNGSHPEHENAWLIANLIASAMVTYWCLALVPAHISRSGVSQLLGLIDRPGPKAITRVR
jgi:Novel STAND NTPase 1